MSHAAPPTKATASSLALRLAAAPMPGSGIGVLVINFNTARQTLRCIESLAQSTLQPDWVLVLDNASADDDYQRLLQGCEALNAGPSAGELRVYRSNTNLGFAEGSNQLIDFALQNSSCQHIMLLNNDAVAKPHMLQVLSAALLAAGREAGMAGGRMHKLADPTQVDTLGIALYASLMPADRKTLDDTFVGPTGGCCMFSRALLEHLKAVSGYYFDARYFCYCEDTDLVVRAVLLGYQPVYVDQLVALHEGQASSGGGYNPFIAYHGLRNTLWMHIKLMPTSLLWRFGVVLLVAHMAMIARHTLSGRFGLMWSVYRDALRRLPEFKAERKAFHQHVAGNAGLLRARLTPRFYRKGYAATVVQEAVERNKKSFRTPS